LMMPPGLGFLAVGPKARERMEQALLPRFYFDVRLYEKALKDWDTPFTPAISLVVALKQALHRIESEGLEKLLKHSEDLAKYTREQITRLGLELFAKRPSNALTAAKVPSGMDGEELIESIRRKTGISIAGGQGEMRGQVLRIAHMGFIRKKDIDRGLKALKSSLRARK